MFNLRSFNISDIDHQELISFNTGEKFSYSAILSQLVHFKNVFIHHEILPSNRRSSSPHCHTNQEEMIFVLTGYPTAYLGNQTLLLKPGDFIGFQPGSTELHFLENQTNSEASILVIAASNSYKKDIIQYQTQADSMLK